MPDTCKKIVIDFMRHGEPEGGDILRGRVDPVLTETGWDQMRRAVSLSESNGPSRKTPNWTEIISSPLQRCCHFAEKTAERMNCLTTIDNQWQEIDYGDWDGMLVSDWRKVAAEQFKAFKNDLSALAPPNGEDYLSFKERVLAAWEKIATKPDGSHLLIVTHGGVLRVILPSVLGMPFNRSFPLHIPFACLSRVLIEVIDGSVNASLIFHNAGEYLAGENQ